MTAKHLSPVTRRATLGGIGIAAAVSAVFLRVSGLAEFLANVTGLASYFGKTPTQNKVVAEYGTEDGSFILRHLSVETLEWEQSSLERKSGTYYFNDVCAAEVILRNKGDNTATVTSVKLVASDIVPDWEPYLCVHAWPTTDGLGLNVANRGWGDFTGGTLRLGCGDGALSQYLKDSVYEVDIPSVNAGERIIDFAIIPNDEIATYPDKSAYGALGMTAVSADGADIRLEQQKLWVYLDSNGFTKVGRDGPTGAAYGMLIDTNESYDEVSAPASTDIPASGALHVPIVFFPTMSCDMKVQISFSISYGEGQEELIALDETQMHFDIDTTANNIYLDSLPNLDRISDASELSYSLGQPVVISFPYGSDEWYVSEVVEE